MYIEKISDLYSMYIDVSILLSSLIIFETWSIPPSSFSIKMCCRQEPSILYVIVIGVKGVIVDDAKCNALTTSLWTRENMYPCNCNSLSLLRCKIWWFSQVFSMYLFFSNAFFLQQISTHPPFTQNSCLKTKQFYKNKHLELCMGEIIQIYKPLNTCNP